MLIGLAGAAGCGKSTVSEHLRKRHQFFEFAFADPLYDMVAALTGLPKDRLKDRAVKEEALEWAGKSPRQLLQLLGTEFGRAVLGDDIWIKHLFRRIDATQAAMNGYWKRDVQCHFAVADVRFDNEAAAIRERGGVIWRIVRPWQEKIAGNHASEGGISAGLCDDTIVNDADIKALAASVDAALQSLQAGRIEVCRKEAAGERTGRVGSPQDSLGAVGAADAGLHRVGLLPAQ